MGEPLCGPRFGTFASSDVTWLLSDLSGWALEAPTLQREPDLQSGRAHYSESLPVEYRPPAEYEALFESLLSELGHRTAVNVGLLAERIVRARQDEIVLVSLARAGTPVGVLLRQWIARFHGVSPVHYSLSIIRDKGLDRAALDFIVGRHDPASIMFVDGWTGKGVITRELEKSVRGIGLPGLDPTLAVVADPGCTTPLYGTREDALIASACLNATVCGLVSRTVHRADVVSGGRFHGAKFYRDLQDADRTGQFLESVVTAFEQAATEVFDRVAEPVDQSVSWQGWRDAARIGSELGVTDINLVKPGLGETTRVLLRRVPHQVRVRDLNAPEVRHIVFLARERSVPIVIDAESAFLAVGVIAPQGGAVQ